MAVKPILFNTEMVRAILSGKKIVTRRVMKPQSSSKSTIYPIGYQPVSQNKTPPAPPTSGSNAVPPKKYCDLFGKSVFATREEAENGFVEEKT